MSPNPRRYSRRRRTEYRQREFWEACIVACLSHETKDLNPTATAVVRADTALTEWKARFADPGEAADDLQALEDRVEELENEETALVGRFAQALGHDGTEAVGVDQLVAEISALRFGEVKQ